MPTRHRSDGDGVRPTEASGPAGTDTTTHDHETALAPPSWDLLPPTELLRRHRPGDRR